LQLTPKQKSEAINYMFLGNLLCVLKHVYIGTLYDEINYGSNHTKI
jgi:hypothetical protein